MTASSEGGRSAPGRRAIERLLETALAPIEPPAKLVEELEVRLAEVQAAALQELADWELAAMRDPRNWVRPAAAVAIGTAAGGALLLLRMRRRRQRSGLRELAEQSRRELYNALADARARLR